jgi:hypothetical protein
LKYYLEQVAGKGIMQHIFFSVLRPVVPQLTPKEKSEGNHSMLEYAGRLSFTIAGAEGRKIVHEEES